MRGKLHARVQKAWDMAVEKRSFDQMLQTTNPVRQALMSANTFQRKVAKQNPVCGIEHISG